MRADIQALRGWAVLVVVLDHATLLPAGAAGYLGVDIFFVVSGYVITTVLAGEIDGGRFSFGGFYARRIRRLLPAAYVTFALTAAAAPLFLLGDELHDLLQQMLGAVSFTANIVLWRQASYFETAAQYKPLLHTWSLAIEEQFYLLWPIVLVWVPRHRWRAAALAGFVASLALCLALNRWKPGAAFYLMPTRAWEIALGCIGALGAKEFDSRVMRKLFRPALIGLALLPLHRLDLPRPGLAELAACAATFVVLVQRAPARVPRALAPMARLGDMSYAVYLVHWPIFSMAANASVTAQTAGQRLALVAVAVAIAAALHVTVENPARRVALEPRSAILGGIAGAALVGTVAFWTLDASDTDARAFAFREANFGLSPACESASRYVPQPQCRVGASAQVLLVGDSMAMHLADALAVSGTHGLVQATKTVCAPLLGLSSYRVGTEYDRAWAEDCFSFQESLLHWLEGQPQIEVVVLAGWFGQFIDLPLVSRNGADVPAAGTRERAAFAAARLASTATRLRAMGKRVVIVEMPPGVPGFDVGRCLALRVARRRVLGAPAPDCSIGRADYETAAAAARALVAQAAQRAGVPVLRPADALCDALRCRAEADGVPLYRDGGHLSHAGSRWLGKRMRLQDLVWKTAS